MVEFDFKWLHFVQNLCIKLFLNITQKLPIIPHIRNSFLAILTLNPKLIQKLLFSISAQMKHYF